MSKISYKGKSVEVKYESTMSRILDSRIKAYEEDEPDTLAWIESFEEDSVFFDVGSNIGGFSFIANMIHDSIKAYCFEPNFENHYCAVKTCILNGIENIFPINVAVHKEDRFDTFFYDMLEVGAKGNFGDELKEKLKKSQYGNPFRRGIKGKVGTIGLSLDSLVYNFNIPKPDYIKIDVDGNELFVLQGAKRLMQNSVPKQIVVEVDYKIYTDGEIDKLMSEIPYKLIKAKDVGMTRGDVHKPMWMLYYERE